MVEWDIQQLLQADATLTGYIPVTKICLFQAPSTITMPWLIIECFSGPRNKIAQNKVEGWNSIRISVDVGPNDRVKGKNAIERSLQLLDMKRKGLYTTNDFYITCSSVNSSAGLNNTTRYYFTGQIRYTETIN